MYDCMMNYVAGQLADGAVERPEFHPTQATGEWPTLPDESERSRIESFILRNTPSAHKYEGRDGRTRVVYLDERGRAADAALSDMTPEELVRLAKVYGMRFPGEQRDDIPMTSRTDHGYRKPKTE